MYTNPERAFGGSSGMFQLIECIYDAAQDATLWTRALGMISDAVQGESIALFAGFPDLRTPDLHSYVNMLPDAWEAYCVYYAAINPLMERCEVLFSPELPWVSDLAVPDRALERTEFYNDFFAPNNMHYSLGLRLSCDGLPPAALSCQRSKMMGAFNIQEQVVFQTLRPHLQRAFQLHHRINSLEVKALGLETALEAHDHAVVGLNCQGNVCFSNSLALKLFTAGDGLRLSNGRLCCARTEDNSALQNMIALHIQNLGAQQTVADALVISRGDNTSALHLAILPMKKSLSGRSSPLAALVFIADTSFASSRAALVRRLYGVTPSEARVADLLLLGLDICEISEKLRITQETARFQVKRLLAKTGTRRQAELLRLLAALPGTGTTP